MTSNSDFPNYYIRGHSSTTIAFSGFRTAAVASAMTMFYLTLLHVHAMSPAHHVLRRGHCFPSVERSLPAMFARTSDLQDSTSTEFYA